MENIYREEKKKSLTEELDEIRKSLDEIKGKKKEKKPWTFKIPWKAKVSKKKLKENYATIMKIDENRNVKFMKEPIDEQTMIVDGIPRIAVGKYVLSYKNKPLIIQPSWSVTPFSPDDDYKKSLFDNSNSAGYKLLMNAMKKNVYAEKKKSTGWAMIIGALALVGIVVYAIVGK